MKLTVLAAVLMMAGGTISAHAEEIVASTSTAIDVPVYDRKKTRIVAGDLKGERWIITIDQREEKREIDNLSNSLRFRADEFEEELAALLRKYWKSRSIRIMEE